jgi:hypothetical protein
MKIAIKANDPAVANDGENLHEKRFAKQHDGNNGDYAADGRFKSVKFTLKF